ncbi:DUF5353 domain-containing protein [Penicillium ucsense]|uniref:DUF5353 domain-containing protein n=1 Tax=Penicillium ucsense TaxID=2839758 RepID=A0A8J8WLN4_9EURO|nr:DUF5353 domain-containing protein [Penicillium ucsense]KAF7730613.1 DUF5353 domain-containing protein [Penicillium ucsense]
MSYADAAAKGPKQDPEDVSTFSNRAPPLGGVYKDESESTASLIDVDSPHVQSVDAEFLNQEVKTTTQAERLDREAAEEKRAQEAREQAAKEAKAKAHKAKEQAKAKAQGLSDNSDNPVYITNAVLATLVTAGLGYGAYRKHLEGKLSWEVVGLWSGAVGAVGVVDYFVSKWFLQNKYPPK